jgi:hypothetical protein
VYASTAWHSAFDVGLLKAKMIGRLLNDAMSLQISSVKAPGTAATPKKIISISTELTCWF